MKKKVVLALAGAIVLSGAIVYEDIVFADDLAEQDRKVADAQAKEAEAASKLAELKQEQASLREKIENLRKDIETTKIEEKRLESEGRKKGDLILKRQKSIAKQARSSQRDQAPGIVGDLKCLFTAGVEGLHNRRVVMESGKKKLGKQKADLEVFRKLQDECQKHINTQISREKELNESEQEMRLLQVDADANVARLNLFRIFEEGKRDHLVGELRKAEEAAKAEREQQKVQATRQRENSEQVRSVQLSESGDTQQSGVTGEGRNARTTPWPMSTSGNTYVPGQCTWYAKACCPWIPNNLGNASEWAYNARVQGLSVSGTPSVGTVAVFRSGCHVAVVTGVNGSTVTINEGNYDYSGGIHYGRQIHASECQYIYPG
ncbi:MAG: CHAP domain-containing protein [Lactobacillales bacterium]|jgi:surface antigen|nr:CHAP domain-containing protein [Lactobacillales bacterium]